MIPQPTPQALTLEQLAHVHNTFYLAPELILSLAAMAVLICGAFFPDAQQRHWLPFLAILGTLIAGASMIPLWRLNAGAAVPLHFGPPESAIYIIDNFSLFFKGIVLVTLAVVVLISNRFLTARGGDEHTVVGEYYGLLMLSSVGMMMVASANDLLVIFLGIETLSIALYVLAGFARSRWMSNEAALKYFLLGAFATGFLLYGIALTYCAVGSTYLPQISSVVRGDSPTPAGAGSGFFLYVGGAMILIGLGFKAALVPFHQWTPDVYEGAPTPVTAFMAVGAKAAAFAALLRVVPAVFGQTTAFPGLDTGGLKILLVVAVLTMTFGNIVAITQDSLKRMLAYSSIAHAGYILIGVLAAGTAMHAGNIAGANDASTGVLFYLMVYALMNLGGFAVLVHLENEQAAGDPSQDSEDANIRVDQIRGLARRNPVGAAAMTLFLLSLAGIPPTAGWFGKLYVFYAAMQQGLIGLLIVGALNTVISFYYYSRPIVAMYMQEGPGAAELPVADVTLSGAGGAALARSGTGISVAVLVAIAFCAVAVLAMFILQGVALEWLRNAALISVSK